jgi:protein-L-isoaspartate O-methyltransferase
MGFYRKVVLPRLIALAMRNGQLGDYRQQTIGAARGHVLEIGVGSGMNLPVYGSAVDRVCGIDPSPELPAPVDALLAPDRRRLPSRPQDG